MAGLLATPGAYAGDVGSGEAGLAQVLQSPDHTPTIAAYQYKQNAENKQAMSEIQKGLYAVPSVQIRPADQPMFIQKQNELTDWTQQNRRQLQKDPGLMAEFQGRVGNLLMQANASKDLRAQEEAMGKEFYNAKAGDYYQSDNDEFHQRLAKPMFDDKGNIILAPPSYQKAYDLNGRLQKLGEDNQLFAKNNAQEITPTTDVATGSGGTVPLLKTGTYGQFTLQQAQDQLHQELHNPNFQRAVADRLAHDTDAKDNPRYTDPKTGIADYTMDKFAPQLIRTQDNTTKVAQAWNPVNTALAKAAATQQDVIGAPSPSTLSEVDKEAIVDADTDKTAAYASAVKDLASKTGKSSDEAAAIMPKSAFYDRTYKNSDISIMPITEKKSYDLRDAKGNPMKITPNDIIDTKDGRLYVRGVEHVDKVPASEANKWQATPAYDVTSIQPLSKENFNEIARKNGVDKTKDFHVAEKNMRDYGYGNYLDGLKEVTPPTKSIPFKDSNATGIIPTGNVR